MPVSIQIVSDLHLETPIAYDTFTITPKAPHLALLGDIGNVGPREHREGMLAFLTQQLRSFQNVFFVPGNHEAFYSTWPEALSVLRSFEEDIASRREDDPTLGEFILMDRRAFGIGHILILGCSLFSHVPEEHVSDVELGMNDFYRTEAWDVSAHNGAHARDLGWLNTQAAGAEEDPSVEAVVVLTHWSPSLDPRTCDPKHAGSIITSGFATQLDGEVCWRAKKVVMWACGHTHYNFDFPISREGRRPLRLLANQRGYYFQQAGGFDPEKVVAVE